MSGDWVPGLSLVPLSAESLVPLMVICVFKGRKSRMLVSLGQLSL